MSLHLFGMVLTPHGVAANNRGENQGNVSTLQKVLWGAEVRTTVSGEAIRYALRETWMQDYESVLNRKIHADSFEWKDPEFKNADKHLDDMLLGYMEPLKETKKRRAALEITRAISTRPFVGDISFNVASVGAQRKNDNPIPYAVEVHSTRYQYGFALSGGDIKPEWRKAAIYGLVSLRRVAGNHSRFLYDFAPASIVLRVTHDPAPRFLYCYTESADGALAAPALLQRIVAGDIDAKEIIVGGEIAGNDEFQNLKEQGAAIFGGVKAAAEAAIGRFK